MKTKSLLVALSLTVAAVCAADSTVTLKNVHLCCGACVRGVERSIKGVEGVTMTADKDAGTVTLTAANKDTLQKAADAMAAGGYFGVSDTPGIKPVARTGAQGKMVQSLIVGGVHLCCGGCADAVDRAIKNTPGATDHTAQKDAVTFLVNGNFNDQKFFEALQQEGLSGKVAAKSADAPKPAPKSTEDH